MRCARRRCSPARRDLGRRVGARVCLKAENLQRTGSFKLRGALNRIASLDAEALAGGVVAASAGNHAQAVAVAARSRGAEADCDAGDAPLAKVEAVRAYGGGSGSSTAPMTRRPRRRATWSRPMA